MNLLQRFLDQVRNAGFFATSDNLLLAVSGGIDSVVLCELSRQAGLNFSIAHGNFGLRGEESERDERFVRNLAAHYRVEIFVMKFETATYAQAKKLSIQEAARDLRYNWFEQLRMEKKMAAILLAHHADDNMETLLMHFFRGTGLQGLTAIPESNIAKKLFRPLLHFRRKEIEAFARQEGLSWVEDSSNASLKYARNNLRHEILPAVKNIYPAVEENLLHTKRIEIITRCPFAYQQRIRNFACIQLGYKTFLSQRQPLTLLLFCIQDSATEAYFLLALFHRHGFGR